MPVSHGIYNCNFHNINKKLAINFSCEGITQIIVPKLMLNSTSCAKLYKTSKVMTTLCVMFCLSSAIKHQLKWSLTDRSFSSGHGPPFLLVPWTWRIWRRVVCWLTQTRLQHLRIRKLRIHTRRRERLAHHKAHKTTARFSRRHNQMLEQDFFRAVVLAFCATWWMRSQKMPSNQ